MNFAFSDEQEQLRDAVRRFLEAKSPSTEVRRLMETTEGYDPAVWSQMGDQLGLQGLVIPEEFGGSGYGFIELVVVLEEMGRRLLCAPYFSSVKATVAMVAPEAMPGRYLALASSEAAWINVLAASTTVEKNGAHNSARPISSNTTVSST